MKSVVTDNAHDGIFPLGNCCSFVGRDVVNNRASHYLLVATVIMFIHAISPIFDVLIKKIVFPT